MAKLSYIPKWSPVTPVATHLVTNTLESAKSPLTFRFNTYVSEITPFYVILPLFGPFLEKQIVAGPNMVNELSD